MSSTNIKHICFVETKPEINHCWPFLLKVGNLPRSPTAAGMNNFYSLIQDLPCVFCLLLTRSMWSLSHDDATAKMASHHVNYCQTNVGLNIRLGTSIVKM